MEFKINQYPSKDEIITGTSNGTFVPKSDSLLLSLFLHNEKEHGHRKDIIRNLLSKYNEFFPVVVFSEKMIETSSLIHSKIISYKSSHDSEIAELFNKLVMLLFYNEKYLNKQKWDFYFDGYRNQSITEQEKHSLLEATVNDMCDLLGLKHIKITQYTYYIDNVTKQYYEKVAYNPSLRKFYIEEIIGRKWSHDEDVARTIVFHLIANCMLDYNDINNKYLKMLNIDNAKINEYKSNKLTHYKDIEQVALALGYYYKIHTGEVTL